MKSDKKIVIPGAAGLVGQNLIVMLKEKGYKNIVAIDKHHENLKILRLLHPDITIIESDLSREGDWNWSFLEADVLIMLQAQITSKHRWLFEKNNIQSTKLILKAAHEYQIPYIVHISSSVVISIADDDYTETKKIQEELVRSSDIPHCVLRPPLMFGWFDWKHLGWLARFMETKWIYPIPGNGHFIRQPLYVRNFCSVIIQCIQKKLHNQIFNIIGKEKIDYIDIIRTIKDVKQLSTHIVKIPYWVFFLLLRSYSLLSANPPFTTDQLKALTAGDIFEVEPWWEVFEIEPTPFRKAMEETHSHPVYSQYILRM
jgi:nucleoside-diphosphate-sugar epimerase